MSTKIQLRRGTAAQWTSVNPVLAAGEPGLETDTALQKIGDGSTAWASLPYAPVSPSTLPAAGSLLAVETLTDAASVTINVNNDGGYLSTLSQATTFAAPAGTPSRLRAYTLRIKSSSTRVLTWNAKFRGSALIPLPTSTSGGGLNDYLMFVYNGDDLKFDLAGLAQGY